MINTIRILQIIICLLLTILILLQVKGVGFGRVWGGLTTFSRRGLEGFVFKMTFVLAFLFVVVSILAILL